MDYITAIEILRCGRGYRSSLDKTMKISKGGTIVEGTAGNTGIGLCLLGNSLGYKTIIVMNDNQTQEKKDLLRNIGADLRLVPAKPYKDDANFGDISVPLDEGNEISIYVDVHGWGKADEERVAEGVEYEGYAIEFTPLYRMKHLPIKLNFAFNIYPKNMEES